MPGLRERKKQRLRSEIQQVALRLFSRQGYEQTTVEQIAAAVDVSAMTVFRYFPTKEDLVFTDEHDAFILGGFSTLTPGRDPIGAVRRELVATLTKLAPQDTSIMLLKGRLMLGVPALRARLWDLFEQSEEELCKALAANSGRAFDDFEVRVAAGCIIGAIKVALLRWIDSNGRTDMAALIERALRQVDVRLGAKARSNHGAPI